VRKSTKADGGGEEGALVVRRWVQAGVGLFSLWAERGGGTCRSPTPKQYKSSQIVNTSLHKYVLCHHIPCVGNDELQSALADGQQRGGGGNNHVSGRVLK